MSGWYQTLVRPALFTQSPEAIHHRTLAALGWIGRRRWAAGALAAGLGAPRLPVARFGLEFPNPVGLAAGMDKDGDAVPAWEALGFGFTELGAVTWHPQPGNPPPRVFRAIGSQAIINRMGFNNPGAEAVARRLAAWRQAGRWPAHPVGMNLGKSRITPLDRAPEDYANSLRALLPLLDFFVVNVSSPNTPNLRQLQDRAALDGILQALNETQAAALRAGSIAARKPLLVKVAPDLAWEALDEILEVVRARGVDGLVATNTTLGRPETADSRLRRVYAEAGGLSGRPLRARSTEVIRHLRRQSAGQIPIIGVGGIFTAADAWEKICAGACLVQVFTGLVYEGPAICRRIVAGLRQRVASAGLKDLAAAVGRGEEAAKERE